MVSESDLATERIREAVATLGAWTVTTPEIGDDERGHVYTAVNLALIATNPGDVATALAEQARTVAGALPQPVSSAFTRWTDALAVDPTDRDAATGLYEALFGAFGRDRLEARLQRRLGIAAAAPVDVARTRAELLEGATLPSFAGGLAARLHAAVARMPKPSLLEQHALRLNVPPVTRDMTGVALAVLRSFLAIQRIEARMPQMVVPSADPACTARTAVVSLFAMYWPSEHEDALTGRAWGEASRALAQAWPTEPRSIDPTTWWPAEVHRLRGGRGVYS